MDREQFLQWVRENKETATATFDDYYNEQAAQEGEDMMYDTRYGYDEDEDENLYGEDPVDLYESYSHCTGHSAEYHGALGVIETHGEGLDRDDEDLQYDIIVILERDWHY